MVKVSDVIGKNAMPATAAGTRIDIQKDSGVKTIAGGIEWDTVPNAPKVDLDIWMLLLGADKQVIGLPYIVWYKNKTAPGGSAYVTEDNRDGADKANKATLTDNYDELAVVDFDDLPQNVASIAIGVSIDHTAALVPAQTFKNAPNAKCIIYDFITKRVLAKCEMTSAMGECDAVIIGEYVRTPSGFTFESIMRQHTDGILGAMKAYGIN